MEELKQINVEQIMERIREDIRRRRGSAEAPIPSAGAGPPADGQVAADFAMLHASHDVYQIRFTSHRRFWGPVAVFVKKTLRRLLTPILMRQVTYNGANTRVVIYLKERLEAMSGQIESLGRRQAHILDVVREREKESRGGPEALPPVELEPEFDSLAFGERFRGSEEEVKGQRRVYVERFRGCGEVLDIGCGRGEFLELLRDVGVSAKGVDHDLDMVLVCKEKALDVVMGEACGYLESLPDASLGGIFAARVIERMQPTRVIQLARLCQRKLRSGGVLILETPNPACLTIFARSFYMDLANIRPVHPEALKFLLESLGFARVELRFSSPVDASSRIPLLKDPGALGPDGPRFNGSIARLNELLFGYQDYAAIATR